MLEGGDRVSLGDNASIPRRATGWWRNLSHCQLGRLALSAGRSRNHHSHMPSATNLPTWHNMICGCFSLCTPRACDVLFLGLRGCVTVGYWVSSIPLQYSTMLYRAGGMGWFPSLQTITPSITNHDCFQQHNTVTRHTAPVAVETRWTQYLSQPHW